jgi:protein-disulfide isomerase
MEPEVKPSKGYLAIPIAIILAGAIIGGAIIVAAIILGSGTRNTLGEDAGARQLPAQTVDISKVKIAGEPFIGNRNAPVTIAYWYDYQCPFCRQNEVTTIPQIVKDYVDTGKVKIVFKDFQFLGVDSQTLGQFSRAVWAVAPNKFYQWHKTIFDNQGTENSGWATHDKIMSITTSVLGTTDATKIDQQVTLNGAAYQKEMDADKTEGAAFGVTGTPGSLIGKRLIEGAQPYAAIKQVIDLTLAEK